MHHLYITLLSSLAISSSAMAASPCEEQAQSVHELSVCADSEANKLRIAHFQAAMALVRPNGRRAILDFASAQSAWHRAVEKTCDSSQPEEMRTCWYALNDARIQSLQRFTKSMEPQQQPAGL